MKCRVVAPLRVEWALASAVFLRLLWGCGPSPTLDMSVYNTTCEQDADCVGVSNSCVNNGCNCISDAIATDDVQRFRDDRQSLQCYGDAASVLCRCREVIAVCTQSICQTEDTPSE